MPAYAFYVAQCALNCITGSVLQEIRYYSPEKNVKRSVNISGCEEKSVDVQMATSSIQSAQTPYEMQDRCNNFYFF